MVKVNAEVKVKVKVKFKVNLMVMVLGYQIRFPESFVKMRQAGAS